MCTGPVFGSKAKNVYPIGNDAYRQERNVMDMTSELRTRTGELGNKSSWTFRCNLCGLGSHCEGRKRRKLPGLILPQYVCAPCASALDVKAQVRLDRLKAQA
jgi:hypothetical protein